MTDNAVVLVNRLPATDGYSIGQITLNLPATLNSLTQEMITLIHRTLDSWRSDEKIACVLFNSSSEKAFCAGGDVQELHRSSVEQPGGPCEYAEGFFETEYRMNFALHTYPKPIICWGHGIVMGGGIGIFAGCSHKVVTEKSRFAMPEVSIALFPDVGGSFFLNKMPDNIGRFLALTAANFNGQDALDLGFATVMLANASRQTLSDNLQQQAWSVDVVANAQAIDVLLDTMSSASDVQAPEALIAPHQQQVSKLCVGSTKEVCQKISVATEPESESRWMQKARAGLRAGSPLALLWIDHQLQLTRDMGLADVFRSELLLGTNIVRHPEFAEGVRALLIDKDRNPNWQYKSIDEVPAGLIEQFFVRPWEANPLADLS